jgi:hypothetical protein
VSQSPTRTDSCWNLCLPCLMVPCHCVTSLCLSSSEPASRYTLLANWRKLYCTMVRISCSNSHFLNKGGMAAMAYQACRSRVMPAVHKRGVQTYHGIPLIRLCAL